VFIVTAGVSHESSSIVMELFADQILLGFGSRTSHMVRTIDSGRFSRRCTFRPASRTMLSMCGACSPAAHSPQNADCISVLHWINWKFWRSTRTFYDGNVGSVRWNVRPASHRDWAVLLHGRDLVSLAKDTKERRLRRLCCQFLSLSDSNIGTVSKRGGTSRKGNTVV